MARSELATEGSVLLWYALGREPEQGMIELYVQAIEMTSPSPVPLHLPRVAKSFPRLLRLFDPVRIGRSGGIQHPFKARLQVASLIANIGFAPLFYDYESTGFVRAAVRLAAVVLVEAAILPVRILGGTLWQW